MKLNCYKLWFIFRLQTIVAFPFFLLSLLFTLPQCRTCIPGTCNPNAHGLDACRGSTDYGPEHFTGTQRRVFLNLWSAECQGTVRGNKDKEHTPSHRIEIKIPDPAGNRTRAAGLECKVSTEDYLYRILSQSSFTLVFRAGNTKNK